MILDEDKIITKQAMYKAVQEHQINRTVWELMALYELNKKSGLNSNVVSARYSIQFFDSDTLSFFTDFSFSVDLNGMAYQPGGVYDLTDKTKTRACVEHYLRKEIDYTYKRFGTLGYLRLKYVY